MYQKCTSSRYNPRGMFIDLCPGGRTLWNDQQQKSSKQRLWYGEGQILGLPSKSEWCVELGTVMQLATACHWEFKGVFGRN